ncbi:unnamed protein product [Phaedon cochleariae]|uniref:TAFII-230 TBP-binding domain-containing protein n=1 Tax=Phaedon cochleariae TaxID=80249 RepID=A0A9N9SEE6_PHACE|nr:unnamed protein product [Phaedon cochleariae]
MEDDLTVRMVVKQLRKRGGACKDLEKRKKDILRSKMEEINFVGFMFGNVDNEMNFEDENGLFSEEERKKLKNLGSLISNDVIIEDVALMDDNEEAISEEEIMFILKQEEDMDIISDTHSDSIDNQYHGYDYTKSPIAQDFLDKAELAEDESIELDEHYDAADHEKISENCDVSREESEVVL